MQKTIAAACAAAAAGAYLEHKVGLLSRLAGPSPSSRSTATSNANEIVLRDDSSALIRLDTIPTKIPEAPATIGSVIGDANVEEQVDFRFCFLDCLCFLSVTMHVVSLPSSPFPPSSCFAFGSSQIFCRTVCQVPRIYNSNRAMCRLSISAPRPRIGSRNTSHPTFSKVRVGLASSALKKV